MADQHLDSPRDFMRLGLAAGPAALLAACGWDGGPLLRPPLRAVSRLNDWVGEKILLSGSRLAPEYPVVGAHRRAPSRRYFISDPTPVLRRSRGAGHWRSAAWSASRRGSPWRCSRPCPG